MKANDLKINGVKIGKHGVRIGGKYFPARYCLGKLVDGRTAVTIYAKSMLVGLPKELGSVQNDSDGQSDYFEKDKVRFFEGSAEFALLAPICHGYVKPVTEECATHIKTLVHKYWSNIGTAPQPSEAREALLALQTQHGNAAVVEAIQKTTFLVPPFLRQAI